MKKTCTAMLPIGSGSVSDIVNSLLELTADELPDDARLVDIDRGHVIESESGPVAVVGVALKFKWEEEL